MSGIKESGIYLRIMREGRPQNFDIVEMTKEEITEAMRGRSPEELTRWITALAQCLGRQSGDSGPQRGIENVIEWAALNKIPVTAEQWNELRVVFDLWPQDSSFWCEMAHRTRAYAERLEPHTGLDREILDRIARGIDVEREKR